MAHRPVAVPDPRRGRIHQHTHQAQKGQHLIQPVTGNRGTMLCLEETEEPSWGFALPSIRVEEKGAISEPTEPILFRPAS